MFHRSQSTAAVLTTSSSELVTHGTVSSTHALYSFNVREQQHERAISWYDHDNNLILKHLSELYVSMLYVDILNTASTQRLQKQSPLYNPRVSQGDVL
jgi:hypothetical protein